MHECSPVHLNDVAEPLCDILDSVAIVWEINSKMLLHRIIYQCYNVTEQM